jgi:rhamnulokinase
MGIPQIVNPMAEKTVLSVDLGAESGRVMAVHFDGRHLKTEEQHRFPNKTVVLSDTLHWDFLRLWGDITDGIARAKTLKPESVGVDTWGVDFGLLDVQGNLIGNPVHYRDKRTDGMMEKAFQEIGQKTIFEETGIQFIQINTLYQLLSLVENDSPLLSIADTFLTAPDLINYWLTGLKACEFTNATTTQMLNAHDRKWSKSIISWLRIPDHIFPDVVLPGTQLGKYDGIPVIAPACHDTGSAVAAVPRATPNFAYISSGTWSLVGLEVDRPVITKAALSANVTNEGGVYGTYRLLKNIMGLWILQQCRQEWRHQGNSFSYEELVQIAQTAPELKSFINPNDRRFLHHGNHIRVIQDFCKETIQPIPENPAAITRCVLESLALAYRDVIETLQQIHGQNIEVIHIVGGGANNELLNQMTSDATGIPVIAGPTEATVIGNALVQLISLNTIKNLEEGRRLVSRMPEIRRYEPRGKTRWEEALHKYKMFVS